MHVVDLRSDTVTRPTRAMREAMANAEVGDDVMGDDPTVQRLQERVAALLGLPAALFVPSGTMANQIALRAHTQPGDEVIVGKDAHTWRDESGGLAANAGIQAQVLADHFFTAADVRAAFKPEHFSISPSRVVAVENTHGWSGGRCWELGQLAEVTRETHALGMVAHLDGARLWNAHVATGVPLADYGACADTVSVCLSKGLGAPIGSVLVGSAERIGQARILRKRLGGGMRQTGMLAAAGLFALEHHVARLADDHARARRTAVALGEAFGDVVDPARVHTNILVLDVSRRGWAAPDFVAAAGEAGVLGYPTDARRARYVWHLDVDDDMTDHAVAVLRDLLAGPPRR